MKQSFLYLKNNVKFQGVSPDWQTEPAYGEVVFTTGMTGYIETLTDPSYAGQIVVFTYPLIGNYGVPAPDSWESRKIFARGIVVSESCEQWSHHTGKSSLLTWLKQQKIPIISGVDTREVTKTLREHGALLGTITSEEKKKPIFYDPNTANLVAKVTCSEVQIFGKGKKKIIAVDCGMKENIMRCLLEYKVTVHRVPYNYDYSQEEFDGIFLSNGPGDPAMVTETISILKKAMKKKKPIFGICLGSQLMGLAAGAKTYKLKYGHRGHNQPCIDTQSEDCIVTSQNHGYAIDEKTLPKDWYVSYRNINDGSVEGIAHNKLPFFSVQFHPEAAPGPTDAGFLFQKFYTLLS